MSALEADRPFADLRDRHWGGKHQYLVGVVAKAARTPPLDLYFLGDSITEWWQELGRPVWQAEFGKYHAVNCGVAGDTTQNILYRITNGEFEHIAPKVVVLLAGINNLGASPQLSPEELARGLARIVAILRSKSPQSKILLLSIFPCGDPGDPVRGRIQATNKLLAELEDKTTVFYLDLYPAFLDPRGEFTTALSPDGLHLNARGYQVWADAMRPALQPLLDGEAAAKP